jgi:hypothetical protein
LKATFDVVSGATMVHPSQFMAILISMKSNIPSGDQYLEIQYVSAKIGI